MTIIILPKDTGLGLDDYQKDGILKRALERQGYTNIYVVANTEWNATKKKFFGLVSKKEEGYISPRTNQIIFDLSITPSNTPVTLILEE